MPPTVRRVPDRAAPAFRSRGHLLPRFWFVFGAAPLPPAVPVGSWGAPPAAQPNIDPDRIVAWGTSFAGMHIIELAASDRRLAASIAQVPLADGTAGAAMIPPLQGLRLTTVAVLDRP
jgi:hypothetical protein